MLVKKPTNVPLSSITKSVASKDQSVPRRNTADEMSRPPGFNAAGKMKNNNYNTQLMQTRKSAEKSLHALHRCAGDLSPNIEEESVVDHEKVKAIKAAISAGTYLVDAKRIAEKLMTIEFHLSKPAKEK